MPSMQQVKKTRCMPQDLDVTILFDILFGGGVRGEAMVKRYMSPHGFFNTLILLFQSSSVLGVSF